MEEDLKTFLENFEEKFKMNNNKMDQKGFVKSFLENMNFPQEDVKALFINIDSENKGWITFTQLQNYCNQNKDEGIVITPEIVAEAKELYEYCLKNYKQVTYDLLMKAGQKEKSNIDGLRKIFESFQNYPDTIISEGNFSECVSKYEQQISQTIIESCQSDTAPLSNASNAIKIDSIIEKIYEALIGANIENKKLKNISSNLEFLKLYSNDVKAKDTQYQTKLEQLQNELEIMQETINKYKLEMETSQNEKEDLEVEMRNNYKNTIEELEQKIDDFQNQNELLKDELNELKNKLSKTEAELKNQVTNLHIKEKEMEKLLSKLNYQIQKSNQESIKLPKLGERTKPEVKKAKESKYDKMNKDQLIKEISILNNTYITEKALQIESLNEALQFSKAMLKEKIDENINLYQDNISLKDRNKLLQEMLKQYQLGKSIMPINETYISSSQINPMKFDRDDQNILHQSEISAIPEKESHFDNQKFQHFFEKTGIIEEPQEKNIESRELLPIAMRENFERDMFIIEEEMEINNSPKKGNVTPILEINEVKKMKHKFSENLDTINLNYNNQEKSNYTTLPSIGSISKTEENINLNQINPEKSVYMLEAKPIISSIHKEDTNKSNLNIHNFELVNNIEKKYSYNESPATVPESDQNLFETFNPSKPSSASHVIENLIVNAKTKNRFSCMATNKTSSALNYDFLYLKNMDIIKEIIKKNKEKLDENEDIFNDYVYQIFGQDEKMIKEKTIIIINSISIYFLDKEKYKVIQKIAIDTITSIILLRNSPYLLIIKIDDESDQFIEIIHRIEFIVFLSQVYKKRNGIRLPIPSSSKIKKFINGNEINEINEKVIKGISEKTNKLEFYTNIFENAFKSGYLQKNYITKTFLFGNDKSEWINKFYVLTNIGMIGFENPNSEPCELIPVNEATKIYMEVNKIKMINSGKTVILQAYSMFDANSWHKIINLSISNFKSSSLRNHGQI